MCRTHWLPSYGAEDFVPARVSEQVKEMKTRTCRSPAGWHCALASSPAGMAGSYLIRTIRWFARVAKSG